MMWMLSGLLFGKVTILGAFVRFQRPYRRGRYRALTGGGANIGLDRSLVGLKILICTRYTTG